MECLGLFSWWLFSDSTMGFITIWGICFSFLSNHLQIQVFDLSETWKVLKKEICGCSTSIELHLGGVDFNIWGGVSQNSRMFKQDVQPRKLPWHWKIPTMNEDASPFKDGWIFHQWSRGGVGKMLYFHADFRVNIPHTWDRMLPQSSLNRLICAMENAGPLIVCWVFLGGWNYYPLLYGDYVINPWNKDPGKWNNQYFIRNPSPARSFLRLILESWNHLV